MCVALPCVKTTARTVVHHHCHADERVETRTVRIDTIVLRPPGLSLEVEALFP